jgi:hypothetical protein
MDLFRIFSSFFAGRPAAPSRSVLPLSVRCLRCGEVITAEINLANDLSADYGEDGGGPTTFFCRKLLLGKGRCFQQIEVTLRFDAERRLIDRQITGGKFVEPAA